MRFGFQSLKENRNLWLVAVFGVYLVALFAFAGAYFVLYRAQRSNFAFNADVLRAQKEGVAAFTRRNLARTADELSYLKELDSVLDSASLEKGHFKVELQSLPVVWVKGPTAKYILFESATRAAFAGSETVHSKLRIERMDGVTMEIPNGPICQLPKNIEDYEAVCATWRAQLKVRTDELSRIEDSMETDTPDVWTFADFVYFSAITQATVGYGDIVPNTTPVRLLVTFQTILSATLLVVVINFAFGATRTVKS